MRSRFLVPAVLASAALALPALAGGATKVFVPGCGGGDKAAFKPATIVIACGDGNLSLTGLHWSAWGKTTATGHGKARQNTCTPNCAQGKFKSYKAKVKLSHPVTCGIGPARQFSVVSFTYRHKRPKGSAKTQSYPRPCSR